MSSQVDVTSEGLSALKMALELLWCNCPGSRATHYAIKKINGVNTLILFWSKDTDTTPLPFPLMFESAVQFIWAWLADADRGEAPDHDGCNEKGWRVYNEAWGHLSGSHYAFVGIQPQWIIYPK